MIKVFLPHPETGTLKKTLSVFRLVLAFFCLCMGIFYWVRLIGVFPGSLWRFDLMSWNWRALCAVLAVVYPVAACGLWVESRWGIVLWLAGAVIETLCLTVYAEYFAWNIWIPILDIIFLLVYAGTSGMLFLNRRAAGQAEIVADY